MAKAYEEENGHASVNSADRRDPRLFVFTTEPDAWQSRLAQRLVDLEAENAKLRGAQRELLKLIEHNCENENVLKVANAIVNRKWLGMIGKALAEQEGK